MHPVPGAGAHPDEGGRERAQPRPLHCSRNQHHSILCTQQVKRAQDANYLYNRPLPFLTSFVPFFLNKSLFSGLHLQSFDRSIVVPLILLLPG